MASRLFGDVSSNNAYFNARAYRAGGYRLISIKATEGGSYVNPDHSKWVADSRKHKLVVAHYHFARPGGGIVDAHAEAAHFWDTVKPRFKKGDYLVLDLEVKDPAGDAATARWGASFAASLLHLSGHRPILYTYKSFLDEVGPALKNTSTRVWQAEYGPHAHRPAWLKRLWAWQRTDGVFGREPHSLAGIGQCDVSVLNVRSFLRVLRYAR